MRSLLVYADRSPAMAPRLETALALARAMDGHVSVLVDTPITRYVSMDPMGGGYVASTAMQQALEDDDAHAVAVEAELAGQNVPFAMIRSEAEPVEALADAARLADLVIVSRSSGIAGELAIAARTPVLVLPTAAAACRCRSPRPASPGTVAARRPWRCAARHRYWPAAPRSKS